MIFVFLEFVKLLGGKRYIYPRVLRLIDITLAPRAVSLVRSASCGLPTSCGLPRAGYLVFVWTRSRCHYGH